MSKPQPPAPRPDAKSFATPALVRWLAVSGVALCGPACAFFLALPFVARGGTDWLVVLSSLAFFGSLLPVSLSIARRSADTIVVDDDGLWRLSPSEPPLFLAWGDIVRVEPQNVMQRLVVEGRGDARRMLLEYHLQNFGELRRLVLERVGRLRAA